MSHDTNTHHSPAATAASSHAHQHTMDASDFLRRFFIVGVLLIPLLLAKENLARNLGLPPLPGGLLLEAAILTAIVAYGSVFFLHAWHELRGARRE